MHYAQGIVANYVAPYINNNNSQKITSSFSVFQVALAEKIYVSEKTAFNIRKITFINININGIFNNTHFENTCHIKEIK